ncbi:MAG: hypothetical protein ACFFDF_03555 [Candidatus Odinarchaeota archaeon]
MSWKPKYKDAWIATWYAAHHVYSGKAANPLQSSNDRPYRPFLTFEDMHFLIDDETLPEGLDNFDTLKADGIRHDFWDNNFQDPGDKKYLECLQHHLNLGVYYTAGVMNYVKDGYTKCEAGMEEALTQTIQVLAIEYAFLWMMAGLSNIALVIVMAQTAVSSALSGKLKIFEALGIPFKN